MGKQNVQNLISFYLNVDMYREFAQKKLLILNEQSTIKEKNETKLVLKDFAKGLINSYLLSANNFTAMSQDEVITQFLSLYAQICLSYLSQ